LQFDVEVVLKGRDFAVTEAVSVPHGEPRTWDEGAVRDVLVEILRAIDRVEHPDASRNRQVALRGFSWIVEPADDKVVIAIEIPMGAAVAGPFATTQDALNGLVTRVLQTERRLTAPQTVH
jgi:hypothetical protein